MISKYLKALIDNNNRIIIPDFGAFMIQDSPEGKQISFNDFLKFNDGLLINQIIKTDKISKNQANDQIKDFTTEVEKSFVQKKPYEVKGLGFLTKDSHGNIKFETKIESLPEEVMSPTDIKPTVVLDEKTEKPKEAKITSKVELEKPKVEKIQKTTPTIEKAKIEEKLVTKSEPPKPTPIKATPISNTTKPINKPIDKKPMTTSSQNSNNNIINIIIIIAAILLVVGGGTWAVFKYNLFGTTEVPVAAVIVPEPVIETIVKDTVIEQPIVVEESPAEVIDENVKKFFLIAGSFKVPSNAEAFSEKLKNEGYESEIIVRNNGFHCVSLKTFYTWNEVVSEWSQTKSSREGIWILIR